MEEPFALKLGAVRSRRFVAVIAVLVFATILGADSAAPNPFQASAATSTSEFDIDAPFTLLSNDGPGEPHIDTIDGRPPSPAEVAAVGEALDFRIIEPPAHMAYATAGSNYFWRGDPNDLDVHLRTLTDMPDEVVLIIKEVFADFQTTIDMALPDELWHEIDVSWDTDLPTGVLAGASTTWVTVSQNGFTYRIPLALYESLGGTGATNNAPSMTITINANADWDMALQPSDETVNAFYLKTVLLHEVGHGLGFSSGISTPSAADSSTPTPWGARVYGSRDLDLSLNVHGSTLLESNDVWFQNADGTWERIFDPFTWQAGSSLSHLDETTYPYQSGWTATPGALMTPYLQRGETSRLDGLVVGMLARMGYTTFMTPLAPTIGITQGDGTATISIDPVETGAANVPAETWAVSLVDESDALVVSQSFAATVRAVSLSGLQPSSTYTAIVTAETDGSIDEVSVQFTTASSSNSTTTTTSSPATTTPTTAAPTTAAPTTTTSPSSTTTTTVRSPVVAAPSSACLIKGGADPFGLESTEMASVYRLYCSYFLRLPDTGGFAFWVSQNESGRDLRQISDFFAESDEFLTRYGQLSDRDYVQLTYINVLEREPDEGGYAYWLTRIEDGLSRGDLTLFFSDSIEFRVRTHTA